MHSEIKTKANSFNLLTTEESAGMSRMSSQVGDRGSKLVQDPPVQKDGERNLQGVLPKAG